MDNLRAPTQSSASAALPPASVTTPFNAAQPHLAHLFSNQPIQAPATTSSAVAAASAADILSELDNVTFALHQDPAAPQQASTTTPSTTRQLDAIDTALLRPGGNPSSNAVTASVASARQHLPTHANVQQNHNHNHNVAAIEQQIMMMRQLNANKVNNGGVASANTGANTANIPTNPQLPYPQQQQNRNLAAEAHARAMVAARSASAAPGGGGAAAAAHMMLQKRQRNAKAHAQAQAQRYLSHQQRAQLHAQQQYQWAQQRQQQQQQQQYRPQIDSLLRAGLPRASAAQHAAAQQHSVAAAAQAAAAAAAANRVPDQYSSDLARKVCELEIEAARKRARLEGAAAKHHVHSLAPDYRGGFSDCFDAWQRLLPYHTMLPPDNPPDSEQKRTVAKEQLCEAYAKWSKRLSTSINDAVAPKTAANSASADTLLLRHILLKDEVAEFKEAQRKRQQALLAERQRQQALLQAQASAAAEAHARANAAAAANDESGGVDANAQLQQQQHQAQQHQAQQHQAQQHQAQQHQAQQHQAQQHQAQQRQQYSQNQQALNMQQMGSAPQMTGMQHQLAGMQHLIGASSAQMHQQHQQQQRMMGSNEQVRHTGSAPQLTRMPQSIPPLPFGMPNAGRAALPGLGELNALPLPGIMGAPTVPREQPAAATGASDTPWLFGARSRQ